MRCFLGDVQAKSCLVTPARTSARLAKAAPEFKGLADDYEESAAAGDGALLTVVALGCLPNVDVEALLAGPCAAGRLQHADVVTR